MQVYLNDDFIPASEARIPVDDRGFLFGDGVYDVIRVYEGRPFVPEAHLARLRAGLRALQIRDDMVDRIPAIADRLLDANELRTGPATIYMQVTRGCAPRTHHFPPVDTPCTVFVAARPFTPPSESFYANGTSAVTVPETRWSRCDVKSVNLLANVLAKQKAQACGATEAIFVRDGVLIEGSHTNVFAVRDGCLISYPRCNYILPGVTRAIVVDQLAPELDIEFVAGPIYHEEVDKLDELFVVGTTTEVLPIVTLDGRAIGDGKPGPIARTLLQGLRALT